MCNHLFSLAAPGVLAWVTVNFLTGKDIACALLCWCLRSGGSYLRHQSTHTLPLQLKTPVSCLRPRARITASKNKQLSDRQSHHMYDQVKPKSSAAFMAVTSCDAARFCDVPRCRSPVFQHQENSGDPGFGRRLHTDHIPSQVKGKHLLSDVFFFSFKRRHQTALRPAVCPNRKQSRRLPRVTSPDSTCSTTHTNCTHTGDEPLNALSLSAET